jgi:hypothetical protein
VIRYLIGVAIAADMLFTFSLQVNPWQSGIVFVAIAAAVALAVLDMRDRTELRDERNHSASLLEWINTHHPGSTFAPFDGDEAQR